jgi:hypothetical protein
MMGKFCAKITTNAKVEMRKIEKNGFLTPSYIIKLSVFGRILD